MSGRFIYRDIENATEVWQVYSVLKGVFCVVSRAVRRSWLQSLGSDTVELFSNQRRRGVIF